MKINQGYKHRSFQCSVCPAFFNKQLHLAVHMDVVHGVQIETPAKRIKNGREASVKISDRYLKGK